MKSFFTKNYHLVLLGVAALAVVGSVVYLFLQSGDLKTSLSPVPTPPQRVMPRPEPMRWRRWTI